MKCGRDIGHEDAGPDSRGHHTVARKDTLWPITRPTQAKHMILRTYLDAWLPILGAGRHAHEHVVLIDGFAGPGRYSGGEPGSPLIMLEAYLDHSATLDATPHSPDGEAASRPDGALGSVSAVPVARSATGAVASKS